MQFDYRWIMVDQFTCTLVGSPAKTQRSNINEEKSAMLLDEGADGNRGVSILPRSWCDDARCALLTFTVEDGYTVM